MNLSTRLRDANSDLARAALEGNFISGLAEGSLPTESFRHYVAQDAYFLESFVRAYALALSKSPNRDGLTDFYALIGGVLEELHLHASYAQAWNVDLTNVSPAPATLAYTDFLLATASLGGIGQTCAAMTPCMRLYAYLGQTLDERGCKTGNSYAEWIKAYAAPEFEELAKTLERLLDRYAADDAATRSAYRRAMELEVAFFEAAFGVSGGDT